jgi:hypothetical protein
LCMLACAFAVECSSEEEVLCMVNLFLEAGPTRGAPGETLVLRGGLFYIGCHDQGQGRPEPPDRDIHRPS